MLRTILHVVRIATPCAALLLTACADASGDDFPKDDSQDEDDDSSDDDGLNEDDQDDTGPGDSGADNPGDNGDTGADDSDDAEDSAGDDSGGTDAGDIDDGHSGDSDDDDDSSGGDDSDDETVRIRVVNATADRSAIDVYVDGTTAAVATGLSYASSSDDLDGTFGSRVLEIRPAGTAATEPPLASVTFEVDKGTRVTAVVAGDAQGGDPNAAVLLTVHEEFQDTKPDEAVVRMVHGALDLDGIAVDLGIDGSLEVTDLARFTTSNAAGEPVTAGKIRVGLLASGPLTSFTIPSLAADSENLLVPTGRLGTHPSLAESIELLVIDHKGNVDRVLQDPRVHVLHAGADGGSFTVCLEDGVAIENLGFGALAVVQPEPGDQKVGVAAGSCTSISLASADMTFEAGTRYLVTVAGETSLETDDNGALSLFAFEDRFTLETAGRGWLRVIHAASAPTVDIGALTEQDVTPAPQYVLFQDLAFGHETDQLDVGPDDYRVGPLEPNATIPAMALASFSVRADADSRTFMVATGDLTAEDGDQPIRLHVIGTHTAPWTNTVVEPN